MSDQWEYKIVQPSQRKGMFVSGDDIRKHSETFLNNFGLQGWECYHVKTDTYPSVFYLKRRR